MGDSKVDIATLLEKGSFQTQRSHSRSPNPYPPRHSSNSPPMYSSPPSSHHNPSPPLSHLDSPNTSYSSSYSTPYSQVNANSTAYSYSNSGTYSTSDRDRGRERERERERERGHYYSQPQSQSQYPQQHQSQPETSYSSYSSTYHKDPSPPPPPTRTTRPKAYTVSYNTVRKSTVPPPPAPTCEDEEVSLAREHRGRAFNTESELYGVVRGSPDQMPVMIENEDYVPEIVPDVIQDHIHPQTSTTGIPSSSASSYDSDNKTHNINNGFVLLSDPTASQPQSQQKPSLEARRENPRTPREPPAPRSPVKEINSWNRDRELPPTPNVSSPHHPRTPPDFDQGRDRDHERDWERDRERDKEQNRGREGHSSSYHLRGQRSRHNLRNRADSEAAGSYSNYNSPHSSYANVTPSGSTPSYVPPREATYTPRPRERRRSPSANVGSGRQYRDDPRSASGTPVYDSPSSSGPRLFGPKPEPLRPVDRGHDSTKYRGDHPMSADYRTSNGSMDRAPHPNRGSPVRSSTRDFDDDPIRPRSKSSSGRRRASMVMHEDIPRASGPRGSEAHVRIGSRSGTPVSIGLASSPMPAAPMARDHPLPPVSDSRSNAPYPEDDDLPDIMQRINNAHLGNGGARPSSRGTRSKYSSSPAPTGPAGPRHLQAPSGSTASARRTDQTLASDSSYKTSAKLLEVFPLNLSLGAFRRYLEDPAKYGLSPLPLCHFSVGSHDEREVTFMTLPDVPDFDICMPCFKAVFAAGPYRDQFIESVHPPPRPHTSLKIRCDFGSIPWYQLGWVMALKRREPRIGDVYDRIARALLKSGYHCAQTSEAPIYMCTLRHQWKTTNLLPDFAVCPRCMECIYTLLPTVYQNQLFVEVKPSPGQQCAFRHGSEGLSLRFINLFDCMEVCCDRGLKYNRPPDGPKLVEELGQLVSFAKCTPPTAPKPEETWYMIEQLEDLTFCGDCYYTCVKPFRHTDGWKRLAPIPVHRALASCELHSDRMKRMLGVAFSTMDLTSMRYDIWTQRRQYADDLSHRMDQNQGRRF